MTLNKLTSAILSVFLGVGTASAYSADVGAAEAKPAAPTMQQLFEDSGKSLAAESQSNGPAPHPAGKPTGPSGNAEGLGGAPVVKVVPGTGTSKTVSVAPKQIQAAGIETMRPYGLPQQTTNAPPGIDTQASPMPTAQQTTALTRQSVPSQGFPGLGVPPGASTNSGKAITVHIQPGVNEMIPVSSVMPNMIATPFKNPKVIDFTNWEYKTIGSNVYVIPKGTQPAGIFITEDGMDSTVASLTLVPKAVPGVSVILAVDGTARAAAQEKHEAKESRSDGYSNHLRDLLRKLAQGKRMSGYTETALSVGEATMGPIRIIPEKQWSGHSLDIFRYRIVNISGGEIELSEEAFYQRGVKAVSFFPHLRLSARKSTNVFIVTGHPEGGEDE